MADQDRGRALTVFAVLFALLAISNLLKPLQAFGPQTGFVLFGHRLSGMPNAIVGPLVGVYLLVYAVGVWGLRRWALPMGWLYAAYVVANLVCFQIVEPKRGTELLAFVLVYAAVAIGVSAGAAWMLTRRSSALR